MEPFRREAPPVEHVPCFSSPLDSMQRYPSALSNQQPPPPLTPPPPPGSVVAPRVDWATGLMGLGEHKHQQTEQATSLDTPGRNEGDGNRGCGGKDKGKNGGRSRKASRPRFVFQTRSDDDILDDGYRWRKYGQKAVKNSTCPRSYYRCTQHTCNVKKQVQRLSEDTSIVVTTYEGVHNHPSEKLMETLSPLLKQMQFLSQF